MKIGIITIDIFLRWVCNYGTLLQNFALQKFLQKHGHETFLIQTKPLVSSFRKFLSPIGRFFFRHKHFRKAQFLKKFNRERRRAFNKFFDEKINKTERFFHKIELRKNPPKADAYIVGSDQIWWDADTISFLQFGVPETRRIAYAPSAPWSSRSENWFENAKKFLPSFDAVSVREIDGISVLKNAGRNDAVHVCDPTLLLEKNDYLELISPSLRNSAFPRKTILAYFLNIESLDEFPLEFIVSFAEKRNSDLKIVPLQGFELANIPEKFLFTPSPEEWLNAYDKADFVFTNSFHGTLFAIIFRKPFAVVLQKGKTTSAGNCRFLSILEKLGLSNRILNVDLENEFLAKEQILAEIDWISVEEKLRDFREKSAKFLLDALKS